MPTRCKLYVSAVKTFEGSKYVGKNDQGVDTWEKCPCVTVMLNAVYSPNGNSENSYFWTATPCGQMQISGPADEFAIYQPGTFWYVDTEFIGFDVRPEVMKELANDPSVWRLTLMQQDNPDYSLRVKLHNCKRGGDYQDLTINNKAAWKDYTHLGDLYRLTILPATKD